MVMQPAVGTKGLLLALYKGARKDKVPQWPQLQDVPMNPGRAMARAKAFLIESDELWQSSKQRARRRLREAVAAVRRRGDPAATSCDAASMEASTSGRDEAQLALLGKDGTFRVRRSVHTWRFGHAACLNNIAGSAPCMGGDKLYCRDRNTWGCAPSCPPSLLCSPSCCT